MMNIESVLNNAGLLLKAYAQRRIKQAEMQKSVKVSVIIPVYNAMPYFAECMRSLLVQTLEDIELIVVDDGSTDGSGELAAALAEVYSIVTVIRQKNAGVSAARNAGLERARGEYIAFADADDYADAELYEKLYTAACAFSADIVNAGYISDNTKDNTRTRVSPPFETGRILNHSDIKNCAANMHSSGCFLFVWRNLFARRLIDKNSIRFDEEIHIGEDTLFNMTCFLSAERTVSVDIAGYHYKIHPESVMQKKYKPLLNESLQIQFERKLALCENFLPEYRVVFLCDMAKYNITVLFPVMLANIYLNDIPQKKTRLKELADSAMMRQAFAAFDLNEIRSRSLDWLMFWCVQHRLYLPAHLLCKLVLYKK